MAGNYTPGGSGEDSPWSGDVPVRAAPVEFDWASQRSTEPDAIEGPPVAVAFGEDGQPISSTNPQTEPTPWTQRRTWVISAGIVAVIIAALLVNSARGGDDEPDVAAPDITTVDDSETSDTIAPDTLPEIDEPEADETDNTSVAVDATDGVPSAADAPEGVWVDSAIEVPEPLRSTTVPSVVVAVGTDGRLHEISLPSGDVRSIAVPRLSADFQFVVGGHGTLVGGFGGRITLVPTDGVPIVVEASLPNLIGDTLESQPGTGNFVGYTFGSGPNEFSEFVLSPDGSVSQSASSSADPQVPYVTRMSPTGTKLINDAGGVYELRSDGSTVRISDGALAAVSTHHIVLRVCDDARVCELVVREGVSGEERVLPDSEILGPLAIFGAGNGVQVSPDGASMRVVEFTNDGMRAFIVDVESGREIDTPIAEFDTYQNRSPVWLADSSGVVRVGDGAGGGAIEFVDRITGDSIPFASELGPLRHVGVRLDATGSQPSSLVPIASGLQLVGFGSDGFVHFIDVDAAESQSFKVPPIESSAPVYLLVDDTGITAASYDNVDGFRVDAATGEVTVVDKALFGGPLVRGPTPGTAWRFTPSGAEGGDDVYELLDALGNLTGEFIAVPGISTGTVVHDSDGRGGLIVQSDVGSSYVFTSAGAERMTTGLVVALGPTVAFVEECDVAFLCGVYRLDRTTGERVSLDDSSLIDTGGTGGLRLVGQRVSPDGEVVFVPGATPAESWTVVDLANGQVLSMRQPDIGSPMVWSDDGAYAAFLSGSTLRLYDRAAGGLRTLNWTPELRAFERIPSAIAGSSLQPSSSGGAAAGLVQGPARVPY